MKRHCKKCGLKYVEPRISFQEKTVTCDLLCTKCENILETIKMKDLEFTPYDHIRIYLIMEEYKISEEYDDKSKR